MEVSKYSNGVRSESKDREFRKLLSVTQELQDNRRISLGLVGTKISIERRVYKKRRKLNAAAH